MRCAEGGIDEIEAIYKPMTYVTLRQRKGKLGAPKEK